MDVEAKVVLDRIKRCVSVAKVRAKERSYSGFQQQMEEIAALLEIFEHRIKPKEEEVE
tara:strand:- start:556 stop:729 length:174 start_codon:yes stop_codon:yes gene_type:complete